MTFTQAIGPKADEVGPDDEHWCKKCEQWLPVDDFKVNQGGRLRTECNNCSFQLHLEYRQRRTATPEKVRALKDSNFRARYGLSIEQHEQMVEEQGGCCWLCGQIPQQPLYVDHDHRTGVVRRLLCNWCNRSLGWFETVMSGNPQMVMAYIALGDLPPVGGVNEPPRGRKNLVVRDFTSLSYETRGEVAS